MPLQRWNGINKCKGLLRVVTICAGELNGQRNAATIADQMTLAAELRPIGRIRTSLLPPKTALIELPSTMARDQSILSTASEPIQNYKMDQLPDSCFLPVAQATPASHARAAAQFLRQHLPRNTAAQHEHDASETRSICQTRSPTLGVRLRVGMNGSTISHNPSGTSAATIVQTSTLEHI